MLGLQLGWVVCRGGGGSGLIYPGGGSQRKTAAEIAAERQAKQGQAPAPQRGPTGESALDGTLRSFRPPAGFLDAAMRGEEMPLESEPADIDQMLSQLKADAGAHHAGSCTPARPSCNFSVKRVPSRP